MAILDAACLSCGADDPGVVWRRRPRRRGADDPGGTFCWRCETLALPGVEWPLLFALALRGFVWRAEAERLRRIVRQCAGDMVKAARGEASEGHREPDQSEESCARDVEWLFAMLQTKLDRLAAMARGEE